VTWRARGGLARGLEPGPTGATGWVGGQAEALSHDFVLLGQARGGRSACWASVLREPVASAGQGRERRGGPAWAVCPLGLKRNGGRANWAWPLALVRPSGEEGGGWGVGLLGWFGKE
jgi:hypothetical protein